MTLFNDLIKRASQFVEKQKGVWDHSKWQAFLSELQQKGDEMTEEMKDHLGVVLESMKKYYKNATVTGRKMHAEISDQAAKLVEKTRGKWEHLDWEKFVADIQKKGVELTEEAKKDLGDVLESAKKFYSVMPSDKVKATPAKSTKKATPAAAPERKKTVESKATRTKKAAPVKKTIAKKS